MRPPPCAAPACCAAAAARRELRYVFCIALPRGERLRRVLPTTAADVERLTRYLADS